MISSLGREYAKKSSEEINEYVKQKMIEREQGKQKHPIASMVATQSNTLESTPQERLYDSYQDIRQGVYREILDTILSKSPAAFERLVIELLQKMGYGGALDKSGRVTKQSRDGGIDGEIREDVLGLGRIHIQAKRYQRDKTIGRPEIQSFAGALLGSNANKGVFITTARYSDDARKYAETIPNARIVLIDGNKLAEYIYQYNLGMQVEQTITIKKLDTDYWDEIPNDADSDN
ncbi:restriction endonuclease [Eikenella sp. Marseille-P7795]|uniref:restriction endonuclease n=1 Tax=Eikenella sp. Marseille-P7795 TaxID=2866577 RepID=UPI00351CD5BA